MAQKRIIEISTEQAEKNVESLTKEILELKTAMAQTNKAMRDSKTRTEDVIKVRSQQQVKLKSLNTSLKQNTQALIANNKSIEGLRTRTRLLVQQRDKMTVQTKEQKREFDKLTNSIRKNETELKRLDSQIGRNQRNVGNYAAAFKGLAGSLGLAFGAGAILQGAKEIFQTAVQLDSLQSKAKTVFGEYFDEVTEFAKQNAIAMGQTRGEFVAAAAAIGDLLVPMGFSRDAATDMTLKITSLSGALAEWSNGTHSAEQVNRILTKSLLGEREQLKELGVDIKEADVQQRLLEKGQKGLTGTALQQAKAQATLELLYEKTGDAQERYANNSDSLIRTQQEFNATLRQIKESLAEAIIPELNKMTSSLNDNVNVIKDKTIPLWQRVLLLAGKQTGQIKDLGEAHKGFQEINKDTNETLDETTQKTEAQNAAIQEQLPLLAQLELDIKKAEAARKSALTEEDLALQNRELQILKDRLAELQKIKSI
jgi:chromosome segregation ATPase